MLLISSLLLLSSFKIAFTADCTTCPAGQSYDEGRDFICQTTFSQGRDVNTCCVVSYLPINPSYWSCILCRPGYFQAPLTLTGGSQVTWCLACQVSNCDDCTGNIVDCITCKPGYYKQAGSPPICVPCPPKCATCESSTLCTSCKNKIRWMNNYDE